MMLKKGNIAVLVNNKLSLLEVELEKPKNYVSYESIRDNVGGNIEHFAFNLMLAENNINCWCDEDGKIKNLPISVVVCDRGTHVIEVINGPVVFTGSDGHGNDIPLNKIQCEILQRSLSLSAVIKDADGIESSVRILKWDTYKIRRDNEKRNIIKSIIKIEDCTEKRDCNICGKKSGSEISIMLGRNNYATKICMCKNCLNIFSEKMWEYLANDKNEK